MKRVLAATLILALAAGFAPADDARRVVSQATAALSLCGDGCKNERGLAAEVWNLRKRVASPDDLRSMAVQVEQGEESCLCGKTNPTATEVEKQGILIAEAVLLWHLAGDTEGVRYNTQRLRNVVAKVAGKPDEPGLMELLVRVIALAGEGKPPSKDGFGDLAVREVAGIKPESMRVRVLLGAATSTGLETDARRKLLTAAAEGWALLPKSDRSDLGIRLAGELRRNGLDPLATAVISELDPASRQRVQPAATPATPTGTPVLAASREGIAGVANSVADLVRRGAAPKDIAAAIAAAPAEARVWVASHAGELSGADAARAGAIAQALPSGPIRVSWLAGVGKSLTATSPRIRYEDVLVIRGG